MRQIKFRGKRLDNGEWVYGHYADYIHPDCGLPSPSIIYMIPDCGNMIVAVDPSTIGQFTGCITHDGQEIYEDDVVLLNDNRVAKVQFQQNLYEFLADFHHLDPEMKILGNIHDNPKLINR